MNSLFYDSPHKIYDYNALLAYFKVSFTAFLSKVKELFILVEKVAKIGLKIVFRVIGYKLGLYLGWCSVFRCLVIGA